jgi:hypothetical protein
MLRPVLACLGVLSVAMSCKKEEEVQYPPSPPQDYTQDAGAPGPGDAAPAADAVAADAAPPGLDLITQQQLDQSIAARARKEAKGMKAEGEAFSGMVQAGGAIESPLMIHPRKCYAVVAEGGTGVQEVDIQIMARPGVTVQLPGPIIAVDSTQGPQASVSPCWKNPFPIAFPASVTVKASQGAGALMARVYVK